MHFIHIYALCIHLLFIYYIFIHPITLDEMTRLITKDKLYALNPILSYLSKDITQAISPFSPILSIFFPNNWILPISIQVYCFFYHLFKNPLLISVYY